jgi:hypothetical protein
MSIWHGRALSQQPQTYTLQGDAGGVRGPLVLSGEYQVYAHATFLPRAHPSATSCLFGATLVGLDHEVPPGFARWASGLPIAQLPSWTKKGTIVLEPGRYELRVATLTDCSWDVVIEPSRGGGKDNAATGPGVTMAVGIYPKGSTDTSRVVRLTRTYSIIAVPKGIDAAARARVTGTVSLVQQGKTVQTFPLFLNAEPDGSVFLHEDLTFKPDPAPLVIGPLTFRFTMSAGGVTLTSDVSATLAP